MVSHNKEEVITLSDRVARIEKGRIIKQVLLDCAFLLTLAVGSEVVEVVVSKETAKELSVLIHSPHLNT